MVAQAFISNPNNYNEINHIDGNKENNKIDNLQWCNRTQNVRHAINTGILKKHQPVICSICKSNQSIHNNYCSNCGEKLK